MSAPTLNVVVPDQGDPEDWADYIKVLKLGECSYCGEPKIAREYYTYDNGLEWGSITHNECPFCGAGWISGKPPRNNWGYDNAY